MTSNWQDKMLATFGGPRVGRSKVSEVQTMDNTNGNGVVESGVWESPIKVTEKPEIVVHGTVDMPYFEIKYHEVGKKYYNVGFSSYDLENCFRWLEEEFEVVEVNSDGIASMVDVVREPEHYKHGTFEVIDEMLLAFGPQRTYDFCIMNAWKYRARAPFKGKMEQDMDKANRYLEMAKQIAEANMQYLGPTTLIKEDKSTEVEPEESLEEKINQAYEKGCVDGYRNRMADEEKMAPTAKRVTKGV